MAGYVTVCKVSELEAGRGKLVQVGGRELALFKVEGELFAVDNQCRHRGGPLNEGEDFPVRLTTGRHLDSYKTGVQTSGVRTPRRRGETLDLCPEDLERLSLAEGEVVRVVSRRGSVQAPVRADPSLRPGLAFMTLHFQDEVPVNQLTIDATDPKSGTAEFKATAVRIEKLGAGAGS